MEKRLLRLILGLCLYAIGISLTIQANIGLAPWDVFHQGLANTLHTTIGLSSIITAIVIVIIVSLLGEKLGIGTLLNMVLIGLLLDFILASNIIPQSNNFLLGIIMLIGGLFIISLASYFYIGSGFGAGPRDNLMVSLRRKTNLPVGICRIIVEATTSFVGWLLGGQLGVGTIIAALSISFCIQITFKLLNFNTTEVKHETVVESFTAFRKAS